MSIRPGEGFPECRKRFSRQQRKEKNSMTEPNRTCYDCRYVVPYVHLKNEGKVFCKKFKLILAKTNAAVCECFKPPKRERKEQMNLFSPPPK